MPGDRCVFCAIVRSAAPAHRVYEDDAVLAFLDIRPFAVGHTLVVPKRHAGGLADLDAADGAAVFGIAQRIAAGLRSSELPVDGVNLVLNDGRAAAQTVFHVHVHVIPRRKGDKLTLIRKLLVRRPGDLAGVAASLRAGLARADASTTAPD
jgi:diadenosine tetraphosphate (Ap4A) HIT family hydrolase